LRNTVWFALIWRKPPSFFGSKVTLFSLRSHFGFYLTLHGSHLVGCGGSRGEGYVSSSLEDVEGSSALY